MTGRPRGHPSCFVEAVHYGHLNWIRSEREARRSFESLWMLHSLLRVHTPIFGITCVAEDASQNCTTGALAFLTQINGQPIDLTPLGDTSNFFKLTKIAGGPGTVFDMTYYLAPSWRDAGATARFISANAVPEPASLFLFGAGILATAAMRRRRKAHKAT